MKKLISLSILFLFAVLLANNPVFEVPQGLKQPNFEKTENPQIFKKILNNGLTVLVKPTQNVTNVAIEVWYNVGSKDEQTDEKGLAHLLEHTVFQGTKQMLSESDISRISNKLSGSCNAITTYDTTHYMFRFPERHWVEALPILADCMSNCTLKQDLLNSEFKAVIQEMKWYKDNYYRILVQDMASTIFIDHPYHTPVIGFKQDIWKITSEKLYKFYKKHYIPNNAALVIVGNIDPNEAFVQAEKYFGQISPNFSYKKKDFYFNKDITSKAVTLYRDVQIPRVVLAFVIPGLKDPNSKIFRIISALLFNGTSSRLYQKLKEEMQILYSIEAFNWDLFDYDLYFISFEPKNINDSEKIIGIIHDEINNIIKNGITENELKKVINCIKMSYYNLMTDNADQASIIGKGYLATGDENKIFELCNQDFGNLEKEIKSLLSVYLRPSIMHRGYILPIAENEKKYWLELQEQSDKEDIEALNQRIRTSEVEPPKYTNYVNAKPIKTFDFPKPQKFEMKNGMKVLYHNNTVAPIISLQISLKAHDDYEPYDLPGLHSFMTNVLRKGTKSRTFKEIADELECMATSLSISPGTITMTMLSSELEKSLNILNEILTEPKFDENEIEKVRSVMLADIKNFWDNQASILNQIICDNIYKNHPNSINHLGTYDSINKISRNDLIEVYKKYITPKGAILAISGDFSNYDINAVLEKTLGNWDGPEVDELTYPNLSPIKPQEINYQMNRDQVYLAFAGLSVDRKHSDFDKLRIFDQILDEGQASKLFELRERTGLFYSMDGSLTNSSGLQPGYVSISTVISSDKLKETESLLTNFIDTVVDTITEEELKQAKERIINNFVNCYSKNESIAYTFSFLEIFNLPYDYFSTKRIQDLQKITLDEVKTAVKKVLNNQSMIKVRVGRVKS